MKSMYIHIPFCKSICTYCDFCKQLYNETNIKKYLISLRNEIEDRYNDEELDTLYIGGGTPSAFNINELKELFDMYKDIDEEKLFENLVYFLKAIMPVCNKYDIKMAIHPDDPAWSVFGLPRIITSKEKLQRMLNAVDDVHNGVTLCTGSLGTNLENDLPDIIRSIPGRIHFAHVRNLKFNSPTNFEEAAHLSTDGTFDMYEIVKALHDINFDGPIRPDHGRMIWDEVAMPGYGLYDRALGAAYICGLWEAIDKAESRS